MAVRQKMTVSVELPRHALTSTERRAALLAAIAGEQHQLKREAAERAAERAVRDAEKGDASAAEAMRLEVVASHRRHKSVAAVYFL